MKILFALLGAVLGGAEFFLTKSVALRILNTKKFLPVLIAKLLSYGVLFGVAFLLFKRGYTVPFAVGLGAGILLCAIFYFIYTIIKEKR